MDCLYSFGYCCLQFSSISFWTRYHVPEEIRQERRRSKRRKANIPEAQNKEGMVVSSVHEAAGAPQPAAIMPSANT